MPLCEFTEDPNGPPCARPREDHLGLHRPCQHGFLNEAWERAFDLSLSAREQAPGEQPSGNAGLAANKETARVENPPWASKRAENTPVGAVGPWHVERYMDSDKPDAKEIGTMLVCGTLDEFPLEEFVLKDREMAEHIAEEHNRSTAALRSRVESQHRTLLGYEHRSGAHKTDHDMECPDCRDQDREIVAGEEEPSA